MLYKTISSWIIHQGFPHLQSFVFAGPDPLPPGTVSVKVVSHDAFSLTDSTKYSNRRTMGVDSLEELARFPGILRAVTEKTGLSLVGIRAEYNRVERLPYSRPVNGKKYYTRRVYDSFHRYATVREFAELLPTAETAVNPHRYHIRYKLNELAGASYKLDSSNLIPIGGAT